LATLAAGQAPKDWREFTSSQGGYIVSYPKSWHLLEPGLSTLYISSFPPSRRVKAVIVPANGATIAIVPSPAGTKDIKQWIARDAAITKVRSRTSLTLQRAQPEKQLAIVEVNFDSIEGPDTTSWYFEIAGRLLVANLSYWREDPNREKYRQVLREVTESVKTSPQ
jgi:hypothetical protein